MRKALTKVKTCVAVNGVMHSLCGDYRLEKLRT